MSVCAELAGEFLPFLVTAHGDDPLRPHLFGRQDAEQAHRAVADDHDGLSGLHVGRVGGEPAVVGELLAELATGPPLGPPTRGLAASPVELPLLDSLGEGLDAAEAAFRVGYETGGHEWSRKQDSTDFVGRVPLSSGYRDCYALPRKSL